MSSDIVLSQRSFDLDDQRRFADVSGDHNPIHVDPVLARRTPAGGLVVHGMHLLLWALDVFIAARPDVPPLRRLGVRFAKPVYAGERAEVVLTDVGSDGARLNVRVGREPKSFVTVTFGEPALNPVDAPAFSAELVPARPVPEDLDLERITGRSGRLAFSTPPGAAAGMFPAASAWMGAHRVAALAAITRLVGMVCPGLHSMFYEMSVETYAQVDPRDALAFSVTKTDPKFGQVLQRVAGGGLAGTVTSFLRSPPVPQPTMRELKGLISPTAFAGSLALIIGGSRGLGELTAKLVATGGGRVIVAWRIGRDDAEKVAQEIREAGAVGETLAYDVGRPAGEQLASLVEAPTHAYYFATPSIFRAQLDVFAQARFEEFLAVYVDGFWRLSQALRERQPRISIFYPSSAAVTERPRGMTEYAMAKLAGEALCADMNRALAPLHITVSRMPRLATDQTASIIPTRNASPPETLLPIVHEVQSWPR